MYRSPRDLSKYLYIYIKHSIMETYALTNLGTASSKRLHGLMLDILPLKSTYIYMFAEIIDTFFTIISTHCKLH